MPKEQSAQEFKVRKLKAKDLFAFVRLIRPHLDLPKIAEMLDGKELPDGTRAKPSAQDIGIAVIGMALEIVDEKAIAFLADLVDMSPEEFNDGPITLPVDVVEQLAAHNDLKDFFVRALAMIPDKS